MGFLSTINNVSLPGRGPGLGLSLGLVAATMLLLAGCGEPGFDRGTAGAMLNSKQVALNGEQIILNANQIACGVEDGLWTIADLGGGHRRGRLTYDAKELGFSDDLNLDAGAAAQAQVNGNFQVRTMNTESLDDVDAQTKLLRAAVGIVIDHPCFDHPLPIMGVRKGEFRADINPVFRFRQVAENQWDFDRLIH